MVSYRRLQEVKHKKQEVHGRTIPKRTSFRVTLPRQMIEAANWKKGDRLEVEFVPGRRCQIVLRGAK